MLEVVLLTAGACRGEAAARSARGPVPDSGSEVNVRRFFIFGSSTETFSSSEAEPSIPRNSMANAEVNSERILACFSLAIVLLWIDHLMFVSRKKRRRIADVDFDDSVLTS